MFRWYVTVIVLWQLLNQCPMKVQTVNLTEEISSGNKSCVFIRELNREPQQYSTDYLYKVPWSMLWLLYAYPNIHALSSYLLLICLMPYYLSTMHLPQDKHAIFMCPNIILFNLRWPYIHYVYTMRNPCSLMSLCF